MAIGVFDSGVGGLTVLRELVATLPGERFLYFGDTARFPYGTKSRETVTRYAIEIANYLITAHDIKMLVVACNTASSLALPVLRKIYKIPVVGMVPAAVVDTMLEKIKGLLEPGDILIDGGNSYYHDDLRRSAWLAQRALHYVDVGVSGGVWGLERGYCLMIGGPVGPVERLDPVFRALAPGVGAAPRTPGRSGDPTPAENGYLRLPVAPGAEGGVRVTFSCALRVENRRLQRWNPP